MEMSEEEIARINKAYYFAQKAHEGQLRRSGEPFFIHPCAVAMILVDMGMDDETICAALLHDVVEDTPYSLADIEREFGKDIAVLVDGVTKLDKLDFFSKLEQQAESLRKMLLAMVQDIRVILIKLADRLHNMRTLESMPRDRQLANAQETLEIYAPIAHRLGIFSIRSELEDLCLKYLEPDQYSYIKEAIEKQRPARRDFLARQMEELKEKLGDMDIECEIQGREKHIYSIYRKMLKQNRKPDEIYDLMAMRVIVNTVRECYAVLGIVHTMYKPIPGRFKDYIAVPKSNMYQSLHTTLINSEGLLFEVQIRTFEMHRTAEYGIAAHWKYKEGKADDDLDRRLAWLNELQQIQSDTEDPHEFLNTVRMDLFSDDVFVFTPKGEVINLVRGATPIDFAYKIHTKVGDSCIGAKANGKIIPLDYVLQTGDVIEIITSKSGKGPSRDWLNIAATNQAKNKIRAYFKKAFKEENIIKGREMMEKEAKRQGYDLFTQLLKPEWTEGIFRKYTFNSDDDMYSTVGHGGVSATTVVQKLIDEYCKAQHAEELKQIELEDLKAEEKPKRQDAKKASHGVYVKGYDNMLVRLAHCCSPVPGDDIVGYITRGRGVSVHRLDCPNLASMLGDGEDRLIEVSWAEEKKEGYSTDLRIVTVDKSGIFAELSRILSNMGVSIIGVNAKQGKRDTFIIDFIIRIEDTGQLRSIIRQFRNVPDVIEVYRGSV